MQMYFYCTCNIILLCWITCDSCIIAAREDAYGRVQKTNQETESVLQSNITTHSCLPLQLTLITDNSKHIPNSYHSSSIIITFLHTFDRQGHTDMEKSTHKHYHFQ